MTTILNNKPPIWCPGYAPDTSLSRGLVALWPMWESSVGRVMDVVGGYRAEANNCVSVATKHGPALRFNGTSSYLQSPTYDDVWTVPGNFTNTGLCYDSTLGCLWIGDYTNNKLVKTDFQGNSLGFISIAAAPQGVTLDTSDDTLWWSDPVAKTIYHIDKSGGDAGGSFAVATEPKHCCYEAATDSMWVARSNACYRYSCSDGSLLETVTVSSGDYLLDGLSHDAATDTLWLTADTDTSYFTGTILNVNSSTGEIIKSLVAEPAIEGIVRIGAHLYYGCDAYFHRAQIGGNRVFRVPNIDSVTGTVMPPFPMARTTGPFSAVIIAKPSVANMAASGLMSTHLGTSGYTFSWFITTDQKMRMNLVTSDGTYSVTPGTTAISDTSRVYCLVATYDGAQVSFFVDGKSDITPVSVTGTLTPFAPIVIGNQNQTGYFNGDILLAAFYNRGLSQGEALEWSRDPWQLIRPRAFSLFTPGSPEPRYTALSAGGQYLVLRV